MPQNGLESYIRFLKGETSALEELVRTYSDSLTRFAYCYLNDSALAEDIMEESFAIFIVKRKHFNDENHLRAYLYKIARNKSIDYLRWRGREVFLSDMEEVFANSNTEENIIKMERDKKVYACMQKLPEQYREVLYLSFFDDFHTEEICRIMKKSNKQIYNLLARSKAALKEILLKEGITHEDIY